MLLSKSTRMNGHESSLDLLGELSKKIGAVTYPVALNAQAQVRYVLDPQNKAKQVYYSYKYGKTCCTRTLRHKLKSAEIIS